MAPLSLSLERQSHPHAPRRPLTLVQSEPIRSPRAPTDAAPQETSIAGLWGDLVEGRMRIVDHQVDETHVHLSLVSQEPRPRAPRGGVEGETLASVLTGCAQKVKAIDFEVSAGAVSARISNMLRTLGVDCAARRAPLGLVMLSAVHALGPGLCLRGYRLSRAETGSTLELCMPRPEAALRSALTSAEYEVLRGVVAGVSQHEVAALRRRSPRTVANQVQRVSAKLGVVGRFQLTYLAVAIAGGLRRC